LKRTVFKNRWPPTKNSILLWGRVLVITSLFLPQKSVGQERDIQWLRFEQLEDSLNTTPKKVFLNFYADWCAYCKKMDGAAFKNQKVIARLNRDFYAVKMNAESTDTITFGGETFVNQQVGKSRTPVHDIPLVLASRDHSPFSLPAMVFLNEKFEVTHRYFEYLSPEQLLKALEEE